MHIHPGQFFDHRWCICVYVTCSLADKIFRPFRESETWTTTYTLWVLYGGFLIAIYVLAWFFFNSKGKFSVGQSQTDRVCTGVWPDVYVLCSMFLSMKLLIVESLKAVKLQQKDLALGQKMTSGSNNVTTPHLLQTTPTNVQYVCHAVC